MPSAQYYAFLPIVHGSRLMMGLAARRGLPTVLRAIKLTSRISVPATRIPKGVDVVSGRVAAVEGSWLVPSGAPEQPVILYVHGGAFVTPLAGPLALVAAVIAQGAGLRTFAVDYRLLPRHGYPAAHDDCFEVYRMLTSGDRLAAIVGDSTGGVLSLATLLRARAAGLPQPRLCVLLSPTVDYDMSESAAYGHDAFVSRALVALGHKTYTGGADITGPDLSPVGHDLRGLAPIHVIVGEREFLRPHADRLVAAARAQGIDIGVRTWPAMWHGWYVMADRLPEGRQALTEAAALIRSAART